MLPKDEEKVLEINDVASCFRKFKEVQKGMESSKRIRNLMFRESSFSEGCLMKNTTCYLVLDGD